MNQIDKCAYNAVLMPTINMDAMVLRFELKVESDGSSRLFGIQAVAKQTTQI